MLISPNQPEEKIKKDHVFKQIKSYEKTLKNKAIFYVTRWLIFAGPVTNYLPNYLPTDVNEMNYINCYVLITTAGVH